MRRAAESSGEGVRDGTSKVNGPCVERIDWRRRGGARRRYVAVVDGSGHGQICVRTVQFRNMASQARSHTYLPTQLGKGSWGVGVPDDQDRTASFVEVDRNSVAINYKHGRFIDVIPSGPDVQVQGEHRDIRRSY